MVGHFCNCVLKCSLGKPYTRYNVFLPWFEQLSFKVYTIVFTIVEINLQCHRGICELQKKNCKATVWHTPCFNILKAESHPFQSLERRFFKTGIKEWLILVTCVLQPSKNGWFWLLIVLFGLFEFFWELWFYTWTGSSIFYNCCYEP